MDIIKAKIEKALKDNNLKYAIKSGDDNRGNYEFNIFMEKGARISLIIPKQNMKDYDARPDLEQKINQWIIDKTKLWVDNKTEKEAKYVFSQND